MMDRYETQVVGFGPAALGIFLAADRKRRIEPLFSRGVLVLERARNRAAARASRFPYVIQSNSPACEFVTGYGGLSRYRELSHSPELQALAACGERAVPLTDVAALVNLTAEAIEQDIAKTLGSCVSYAVNVARLVRTATGSLRTLTADGSVIAESANVILATGADENPSSVQRAPGSDPEMVVPSARVLRGELGPVIEAVEHGFWVHVIGSSHSAFSALTLILKEVGDRLRPGQLRLVCREVRLYFDSVGAAEAAGHSAPAAAVYEATGEVNKFDGLRGQPRSLYLDILAGVESRVTLMPWEAFRGRARRSVCVSAVGYSPRSLPITDECRAAGLIDVPPELQSVDEQCRVLIDGKPVVGLYGLGIGYPRRLNDGPRRIGLNFFHGADAELIVEQLSAAWPAGEQPLLHRDRDETGVAPRTSAE